MADPAWIETYREYSLEELTAEIANLKAWSDPVTSQQAGEKSYTKEPGFAGRLAAATRVFKEKGGRAPNPVGIANFANINMGQPSPCGVPDQVNF